jgi:hypothetical protein
MKKLLLTFLILICLTATSQNVGIGVINPLSAKLEINGGLDYGNTQHSLRLAGNNPFMDFSDNDGVNYGFIRARHNNNTGGFDFGFEIGVPAPPNGFPDRSITFSTYYTPRMVIKPNGNIGIGSGTVDPVDFKLNLFSHAVESNDNTHILKLQGRNPLVGFFNSVGQAYGFIKSWTDSPNSGFSNGLIIGANPGQNVYLSTNYAPTMVVANSGNVGIGTSSPSARLHVNNDNEAIRISGNAPYITLHNGTDYKGYLWNKGGTDIELGTAAVNTNGRVFISNKGTPSITVQSNGMVKIGNGPDFVFYTATGIPPNAFCSLGVSNGIALKPMYAPSPEWVINAGPLLWFLRDGVPMAILGEDGFFSIPTSDSTSNLNITPNRDILGDVRKLKVSSYTAGNLSIGLLEQEVKEYFPEIVRRLNYVGVKIYWALIIVEQVL